MATKIQKETKATVEKKSTANKKQTKKVAVKNTSTKKSVATKKTVKKKSAIAGKSLKSQAPKSKTVNASKSKKETINIFFAATDNYIKYMDVAITSLIENASKDYNYQITVLHNGLSEKNAEILKKHETKNVKIDFKDVEEEIKGLRDILPDAKIFSMASYYRLLIEKMYPNLDRAIYLDCDIVVPGDISELFQIDLDGNLVAAVNEQNCFLTPLMTQYTIEVAGIDPHKFFNTGVLLLDLKKIREFKLLERLINTMTKYNFVSPMVDQDYLNNVLRHRVKLLPNGWNKESVQGQDLEGDLKIKHFALGLKPWKSKDVEYADLWWDYARKSDYFDELNEEFSRVTPEDLARDQMMAGKLFELAGELLKSDHTFKKLIIDVEDR